MGLINRLAGLLKMILMLVGNFENMGKPSEKMKNHY
jgi:hypothetical protein